MNPLDKPQPQVNSNIDPVKDDVSKTDAKPLAIPVLLIMNPTMEEPHAPNSALDAFSTAAMFCTHNVLPLKDLFGIKGHSVTYQPSVHYGTFCNTDLDSQSFWRTIYGDGRDDVNDFVIAILESVSAYLKYQSFKSMLPNLQEGLSHYTKSYKEKDKDTKKSGNVITSLKFAIDRIKEARLWTGTAEDFQKKYDAEFPEELIKNRTKFYDYWSEAEIAHVINGIHLAILKHENHQNSSAEVQSTFTYLTEKQIQITPILEEKQLIFNGK